MRDTILEHLETLVGFDTTNPPRAIHAAEGVFAWLTKTLPRRFTVEISDHGDGSVNLFATRGKPRFLFNVHLDTVPVAEGWTGDPFELRVEGDRAIGLGACDIKGAAACLLTAIQKTKGDLAILFTSDEEAGQSECVRRFLAGHPDLHYDAVFVAEPTGGCAVTAHRGLITGAGEFHGVAGHSSEERALRDSAILEAVRWAASAAEFAAAEEDREVAGLRGICFNIGTIEGGVKPNMIASSARVRWSARPRPGQSADELRAAIESQTSDPNRVGWTAGFHGPPLPAAPDSDSGSRELVESLGLEMGPAVNFWTEAALFSEAGHTAIVLGPGDIAQAHTADEWVAIDDLERVAQVVLNLIS